MALSTLRLLCSDLKADKRWRQYAGAQVHDSSCPASSASLAQERFAPSFRWTALFQSFLRQDLHRSSTHAYGRARSANHTRIHALNWIRMSQQ